MLEMGILMCRKVKRQPGLRRVKVSMPREQGTLQPRLWPTQPSCRPACPHSHAPGFLRSAAGDGGGPVSEPLGTVKAGGPRRLAGKAELWSPNPHGNWIQTQAGGRCGKGPCQWAKLKSATNWEKTPDLTIPYKPWCWALNCTQIVAAILEYL